MQIKNRINFLQMERYGNYNEQTYRLNFSKGFNFQEFNRIMILEQGSGHYVIAFDPSHIKKSGKKTFGKGKFWSGCDNSMKQGLELGGFAVCDIDNHTAFHLEGFQTPSPASLKEKGQNLLDYYGDLCVSQSENFKHFSSYLVVDAYFSKYNFIEKVVRKTNLNIISRLRDDANLRYLYFGEPTGKKGQKKKYVGKINTKNPDLTYFKIAYQDKEIRIYGAIVYAVALKRNIKLSLTQHLDEKGNIKTTKLYFSTDLDLGTWFIVKYYQNRFQIEFLYRDANQFTGLEDCQARDEKKLHFHFNTALTTVSVMKVVHYLSLPQNQRKTFSMASLKVKYHNELLLQKFFEVFDIDHKQHINSLQYQHLLNLGVIHNQN